MKTFLRWLFAVLVLANLGVVMWASWYREPPVPPARLPLPPLHPEKMVPVSVPGLNLKLLPSATNAKAKATQPAALTPVKTAAPPPLAPIPPPPPRCLTVGPFDTDKAAQDASKGFKADGVDYALRTESKKEISSYWVYLPPLGSRYRAELMLKRLDRLGIRDHVIVTGPVMTNAISLGLYAKPENARDRIKQLAKKGLHAKEQVRYRTSTQYWLDVEVHQAAQHARLMSHNWGTAGVSAQDVPCKISPEPAAAPANAAAATPAAASSPDKKQPPPENNAPAKAH